MAMIKEEADRALTAFKEALLSALHQTAGVDAATELTGVTTLGGGPSSVIGVEWTHPDYDQTDSQAPVYELVLTVELEA
jgi:hypothetical protein